MLGAQAVMRAASGQGGAMAALRRVRKDDVKAAAWVDPDGLDLCLQLWKASMHWHDRDLGHQCQKTLCGDGDGYGNDDTAQTRRDNEIAAATGAMIDSLRASERWAIYRLCSLAAFWPYSHLDFVATAMCAKIALEIKLRRNVATSILFK